MSTFSKDNKLLDEFIGSPGQYISHKDEFGGEYWGEYIPNNYHSDWNELMRVVDKINGLKTIIKNPMDTTQKSKILEIRAHLGFCNKKEAYNCVLGFVKWYNKQNEKS